MNTILESIHAMTTRQQAEAYLSDKPGHAIKAAYTAWIGRKAATVAKARDALIGIAGAVSDHNSIIGAGR